LPDPNTRVSALRAGEVDALVELGAILPAQADQLRSQPDLVVGSDPISITQYLHFRCDTPPFDDPRLRRVIAAALNRDELTKEIVFGFGEPGRSLLSPFSSRWFSPKGTPAFDPALAASLAREALGDRRVDAVLPFTDSAGQARPYKEIAAYLQSVVRPLGIDLRLQQLENAALTDVVNRGEWNLRFSQLGWANGDPDFIMGNFMFSRGGANTTSKGAYRNDEVDRLVEEGRQERDRGKRFAIYERMQEIAARDVPVLALYHEKAPYAHHRAVSGLRQRLNFQPTFDLVTKA
jgi:peptide/nickel transport system substrate-binding protein